ncbi:MAG: flagellar filament capping protein FliD [Acidobacteriota bacterium]|nr:flagellar filament capping protein FliD [Acidobacteriota bacterium]
MAGVNFSGIASGLDTSLLIESLLVNQQRRVTNINNQISENESRKRAFNSIKSAISDFESSIDSLGSDIFGNRAVTSADTGIVEATADETSSLGEHEIKVNNLAQRSVVTVGLAQSSATATIGAGTLDLNFQNADAISVTLTDANSTLTDLRDAINDQNGETVQASIVEVSSGSFQLVLSAKDSGADLNIQDETDGASSSSLSSFDTTFRDVTATNSGGITRTQDGENAEIVLDGITISRSSNEIDDVLTGVTLNLKGETQAGEGATQLKVDSNFEEAVKGLEEFANKYNDLLAEIGRVTNSETGVLKSDQDFIGLRNRLQSQITRFVTNSDKLNIRDDGEAGFTSLAQIGFETDRKTGSLTLDTKELKEALEDNFAEVQTLFLGGLAQDNNNVNVTNGLSFGFSDTVSLDLDNDEATIDGTTYSLNRDNGVLTFQDGSGFEGLVFEDNGATGIVTLDFASGIGGLLKNETERFTEFSGIINDRTESIDDRNRDLERNLDTANLRLENERTRLTAIFAKAEQSISSLQGLSASLGAQSVGGFNVG